MITNARRSIRRILPVCMAIVMIFAYAVPAAAAGAQRGLQIQSGLYVTDDGLYGVYIIDNNPGAVGIGKYFGDKAQANLTVPAFVSLNGADVPVCELGYYAYENHPEIETVRFEEGIRRIIGDPFKGCSGIQKIWWPASNSYLAGTAFLYFDHAVQCNSTTDTQAGSMADYVDVEILTDRAEAGKQFKVKLTLRDGVQSLPINVYLQGSAHFISVEPVDPGDHPDIGGYGPTFIGLGYDPDADVEHGRTRTFTCQVDYAGQGVGVELVGSVPVQTETGIEWEQAGTTSCVIPKDPGTPNDDAYYARTQLPALLPIPANVAPMQQETLALTNELRADAGSEPLKLNDMLNQAAMVRATEMALAEEMSHTRPNGEDAETVIVGLSDVFGENVAAPPSVFADNVPADAVEGWHNSPGHYQNMIEPMFNAMGVGYAMSKSGRWYGCQLFATVRPSTGLRFVDIDSVKLLGPYDPTTGAVSVRPAPAPKEPIDLTVSDGLRLEPDGPVWRMLRGVSAAEKRTVSELLSSITTPDGRKLGLYAVDGHIRSANEYPATGDEIVVYGAGPQKTQVFLEVMGDVVGTGKIDLTQLIRMSMYVNKKFALAGPYLTAGDHNGSGDIELSDLIQEAKLLMAA